MGIQIRPYAYTTFDNLDGSFLLSVSLGGTHQLYVVWYLYLVPSGLATTDPPLVSLSTGIGLTPIAICGGATAVISAWLIPHLAAQWIMALGCLAILIGQVLIATMPEQQSYWAQVFPATILSAFCPDFIFTAAQIIACNSVKRHEQGIAGSLVGVLQVYATSTGLGFAGIIETHTDDHGSRPVKGYRSALYFGMGMAVVALVIGVLFVKMPKDTREGWQDRAASPDITESKLGDTIHV